MDKRDKIQYLLLFAADTFSIIFSALTAWLFLDKVLHVILRYEQEEQIQFLLLLLVVYLIMFLCQNSAADFTKRGWKQELWTCVRSNVFLAAGLAVFLLLFKAKMLDSRYLYTGILFTNTVVQFLVRCGLKQYLNHNFYKCNFASLVGVVTTVERADVTVRALKEDWTKKVQGVVLLEDPDGTRMVRDVPVTAHYGDFMEWIRGEPLDEVYINVPYHTGESLKPIVDEMESMGLTVHLNIPPLEDYLREETKESWMPRLQHTLEETGGFPFVTLSTAGHRFEDMVLKRCMDIVGGVVGLILSAPIILITAIPLKLESPGPLFFKQKRVGRNGRVFSIYKLRSMYRDAENRKQELMNRNKMQGLMFKVDDDPRITKVGRFIRRTSIDELPQFWNVLKGDMSLVGTRPPTMDEFVQYESHHKRRLSMKPGLTGLWQVSGRSNVQDFEEVVRLDVTYIDNWSLNLDVKILLKTVRVVLQHIGAE